MALHDVTWGYCRHCHREEEVAGGLLIVHRAYERAVCAGSLTEPTAPPEEGSVSVLTVSVARRPKPLPEAVGSEVQDMARDTARRSWWRRIRDGEFGVVP